MGGWIGLRNTMVYEKKWLAEEAGHEASAEYPEYLKKMIEENGYLPKQVFSADEMVLFWKHMPACTDGKG